jgi:hypothetical protein
MHRSSWQLCSAYFDLMDPIYSGLENREYDHRGPSCWPRGTLYPQKFALTSLKSGCPSVGIVRSRTQATELSCWTQFIFFWKRKESRPLLFIRLVKKCIMCSCEGHKTVTLPVKWGYKGACLVSLRHNKRNTAQLQIALPVTRWRRSQGKDIISEDRHCVVLFGPEPTAICSTYSAPQYGRKRKRDVLSCTVLHWTSVGLWEWYSDRLWRNYIRVCVCVCARVCVYIYMAVWVVP